MSSSSTSVAEIRKQVPVWLKQNPLHFQNVSLSPTALTKILLHCQRGCSDGNKNNSNSSSTGNPVEVMGMLVGHPSPDEHSTQELVVTNAYPLPIEGFETRVVADDQEVIQHMIQLGETTLEPENNQGNDIKFMGWYHSHPFDIKTTTDTGKNTQDSTASFADHCFLSQTDLTTQLQWQRTEDPHGNPFVAIVVDPLLTLHLQRPILKAFRAYPPEYNHPVAHQCPDGSIETNEQKRLEQWGSCWNRYYELKIQATYNPILQPLSQDSLAWVHELVSGPPNDRTILDQVQQTIQKLKAAERKGTQVLVGIPAAASAAAASVGSSSHPQSSSSSTGPPKQTVLEEDPCVQAQSEALQSFHRQTQEDETYQQTVQLVQDTLFL